MGIGADGSIAWDATMSMRVLKLTMWIKTKSIDCIKITSLHHECPVVAQRQASLSQPGIVDDEASVEQKGYHPLGTEDFEFRDCGTDNHKVQHQTENRSPTRRTSDCKTGELWKN